MSPPDFSATSFDEAVEVARGWIEFAWSFRRNKVFAFPPGMDVSLSRIRRCRTRKDYDHLKLRIAATLRRERQLPPNLSEVAADVLEGKRPRFKKQRPINLIIVIGMAVEKASWYVPTYRNESTLRQISSLDAVAQAATLCGRWMTYDMVADRYKQYLRH